MTRGFLLDTNHLGHAVTPGSAVKLRISEIRARGEKVGTCVPVLCELEAGIQQVRQPDTYRENLDRLLRQVSIWPIDRATARLYGVIHQSLKRRGRVLSQVDMILAAVASQLNLTLVTTDRDFAALPEIVTEDWLLTTP